MKANETAVWFENPRTAYGPGTTVELLWNTTSDLEDELTAALFEVKTGGHDAQFCPATMGLHCDYCEPQED